MIMTVHALRSGMAISATDITGDGCGSRRKVHVILSDANWDALISDACNMCDACTAFTFIFLDIPSTYL